MALARVQATPKSTGAPAASVTCTFGAPPTIGNAVVVLLTALNPGAVTGVADNRGHTYTLARFAGDAVTTAAVYYCPILTATGTPFTITVTVTTGGGFPITNAVEVSGAGGAGLAVNQSSGATGGSSTPATGATAALTATEAFLAAALQTNAGHTSITVVSASPSWTQEYEAIAFVDPAGEADSRIVTSAAGSTPSCSWTTTNSASWAAVLVAFGAGGAAGPAATAQPYVWGPL